MTFSVTIGSNTYEVYGGLTAAQARWGTILGNVGVVINGLPSTAAAGVPSQSLMLAASTNFFESQVWQGQPTTPAVGGTTLSWPRTNVVDEYGNPVDSGSVPDDFVNGVFELAALLSVNPGIIGRVDAGTNIKGVGAGPARVDYFVPTSAQDGSAPLFPPAVQRLVAQYLAAAVDTVGGGIKSGGDRGAIDRGGRTWDRSWPF